MPQAIVKMKRRRKEGGLAVLDSAGTWRDISVEWFQNPTEVEQDHKEACERAVKAGKPEPKAPVKVHSEMDVELKHIAVGSLFPRLSPVEQDNANTALRIFLDGGEPMPGYEVIWASPVVASI